MNAIKNISMLMRGVLALVMAAGMLPAAQAAETVEYIHTDALGSPVAVTDANGVVIERTVYEPYGAVVGGPVKDGPGYTGHVSDSATGLSQMQQRYMDPELGAFLSVDPVTVDVTSGENFSRFKYAANNPYRFTDPDGRQEMAAERFSDSYGGWTAEERAPLEAVVVPAATALISVTPVIGPELALGLRIAERSGVPRTGQKGVEPGRHNANVTVRDSDGNIVSHHREVSGNMTPEEKALGFPQNTMASHTEARAVQTPMKPGDSMTITGQRAPCPSCKGRMNSTTQRTGSKIKYQWREGGKTQRWESKGG